MSKLDIFQNFFLLCTLELIVTIATLTFSISAEKSDPNGERFILVVIGWALSFGVYFHLVFEKVLKLVKVTKGSHHFVDSYPRSHFWIWLILSLLQMIGFLALLILTCIEKEKPWIIGLFIFIGFEILIKVIIGKYLNKTCSRDF